MSNSKILVGFLAGAAVGSVLGILFAPDKGTETRRKIADSSTDVTDSLKQKFNDFVDGIKDSYQGVKDDADDLADEGRSKLNTFKNEAKNFQYRTLNLPYLYKHSHNIPAIQ